MLGCRGYYSMHAWFSSNLNQEPLSTWSRNGLMHPSEPGSTGARRLLFNVSQYERDITSTFGEPFSSFVPACPNGHVVPDGHTMFAYLQSDGSVAQSPRAMHTATTHYYSFIKADVSKRDLERRIQQGIYSRCPTMDSSIPCVDTNWEINCWSSPPCLILHSLSDDSKYTS